MRLDADRELSPSTVEAIRDLFPERESSSLDDEALLRVALGLADLETRLAYARAALTSPTLRMRLVRLRASLREGEATGRERADLAHLAVFPGPFTADDARAVFPGRFEEESILVDFVERGWLDPGDEGTFQISTRVAVGKLDEASWETRFVERFADTTARIGRVLSEGRWTDGSAWLMRTLPNVRAAWDRADRLGRRDVVEALARTLVLPLLSLGRVDTIAEILTVGYRAAAAMESEKFRAWLLSMEGVVASYRGDAGRARALWTERLEVCRREGLRVGEADVLLDLAGQAKSDGNPAECRRLLAEAEPVVAEIGRPDFEATIWSTRAVLSLDEGRLDEAARHAERALATLVGTAGANVGLFVRMTAAQTLVRCGRPRAALRELADVLERSAEAGSAPHVAIALMEIAPIFEMDGQVELAGRSLRIAVGIHRRMGAWRLVRSEAALRELAERCPEVTTHASDEAWDTPVQAILTEIRNDRGASAATGSVVF